MNNGTFRALLVVTVLAAIIFVLTQELQASTGDGMSGNCNITSDPSTWPSGDRVWSVCQAIAFAEGANVPGSVPDASNNPGDLSKGDEWGQDVTGYDTTADGENLILFSTKQGGWQALYDKINNIASGKSSVYSADWTWQQIAAKYAANSGDWASNVASELGVSETSTLAEYVNG